MEELVLVFERMDLHVANGSADSGLVSFFLLFELRFFGLFLAKSRQALESIFLTDVWSVWGHITYQS